MSDTDPDLDRLQDLLTVIPPEREGMNVVELNGYVAAPIVCLDTILPSEWLPGSWGEDHAFANSTEAEATIAAVMGHYNRIARDLADHPEDYAPVLGIDPNSGETLWEPWIDGFERAVDNFAPDNDSYREQSRAVRARPERSEIRHNGLIPNTLFGNAWPFGLAGRARSLLYLPGATVGRRPLRESRAAVSGGRSRQGQRLTAQKGRA